MQQVPQGGGGYSSAGVRGNKAKIKPFLWVNLTTALPSTSIQMCLCVQLPPSFPLSSVYSEFSLGCIHVSLPNSLVASCVVSLQLDYRLLKVHTSLPFSPIMPKQIWVGAQERLAERRAQWINLSELYGREKLVVLWSVSCRCCLYTRHWFLWVPHQTQLLRHRGLPPTKCGSNSNIFICHVTHIISEPLRSPCISEHWQSSIKFWGKLWNLWNENQFHLHFMGTNVAFTT